MNTGDSWSPNFGLYLKDTIPNQCLFTIFNVFTCRPVVFFFVLFPIRSPHILHVFDVWSIISFAEMGTHVKQHGTYYSFLYVFVSPMCLHLFPMCFPQLWPLINYKYYNLLFLHDYTFYFGVLLVLRTGITRAITARVSHGTSPRHRPRFSTHGLRRPSTRESRSSRRCNRPMSEGILLVF